MVCFLFTLTPPVAVIWYFSEHILSLILPEPESARLAGLYLKVMIFGVPGIVLFECGKRFTQAQGIFHATTYVLFIVAPLNIFICWLLVWKLEYGFIGAPISVVITENLLPLLLFLFVRFVDGSQCWGGFSKRAFSNWWVMIRLALPGMIMVEAEWLAFEIMTLLASRFGSNVLAAQSILSTLASISYQIPFPVSIAASTRIANLIGAGLVDAAKTASKVVSSLPLLQTSQLTMDLTTKNRLSSPPVSSGFSTSRYSPPFDTTYPCSSPRIQRSSSS
jgi:MATE family multidrug resistance protein